MVILYKFVPAWGMPDLSPFCVKLETYLRMAEVPFESRVGDSRKAPKGKLPYIEHRGHAIADSSLAVRYLKQHFGDPLDVDMSAAETAQARVLQSMLEEHLYFVGIHETWQQESSWLTYQQGLAQYAKQLGVPALVQRLLLPTVRRSVLRALHGQGVGRLSPEEVGVVGSELIAAVAELLGNRNYIFGDQPRSIDAIVFAFLLGFVRRPINCPTHAQARSHSNLVAYCDRIEARYYT